MPHAARARSPRALLVVVLVAGLVAALHAATATGAASKSVSAKLSEFKVSPSNKSVAHGRVTFTVRNSGEKTHELVVIRSDRSASKLPVHGKQASEKGAVGEVEGVAAGKSKKLTLNLKKGHYVLICNIPGHYKAGMRANLTVS
jgi:uncharacterized cupredoxin-like copper-binding protein